MRRRLLSPKLLLTVVALLLAAVLLVLSLRGVNWRAVYLLVLRAEGSLVALGFLFSVCALFLRSLRWRILLSAEANVRISDAFWATSSGYFGNNFLPGRAGELLRSYMISSRTPLSAAYVLTTALSERVADAITLVTISALVLATIPSPPPWMAVAAKPFALIASSAILVMIFLPRSERFAKAVIQRLLPSAGIRGKVTLLLEQVLRGMRTFHNSSRLLKFLVLTLLIWNTDAMVVIALSKALGLSVAFPIALLLLAGLGLGSALPSTPGYVGIYQFVAVSVLTPFGVSRSSAVAFILLAQGLGYFTTGVLGAIGLLRYQGARRFLAVRKQLPVDEPDVSPKPATIVLP